MHAGDEHRPPARGGIACGRNARRARRRLPAEDPPGAPRSSRALPRWTTSPRTRRAPWRRGRRARAPRTPRRGEGRARTPNDARVGRGTTRPRDVVDPSSAGVSRCAHRGRRDRTWTRTSRARAPPPGKTREAQTPPLGARRPPSREVRARARASVLRSAKSTFSDEGTNWSQNVDARIDSHSHTRLFFSSVDPCGPARSSFFASASFACCLTNAW